MHYTADPHKDDAWVALAKKRAPSDQWWQMEMEIQPYALSGALVFPNFRREFTVVEPFAINPNWPRWMGCDPHPRVPHAFLWMAINPYGDHIYYRDYWPSKAYGIRGPVPEDDDLHEIDDYVDTVQMLEGEKIKVFGPNGFSDNSGQKEKFALRIMDPSGKQWEATRTKGKADTGVTFWDRYLTLGLTFKEARKDFDASKDLVNTLLRPNKISGPDGVTKQSTILIFDTCEELILELETNRHPQLTPHQKEIRDPIDKELQKRRHLTDLMRYIESEGPAYYETDRKPVSVKKVYPGVGY